jgi:predicted regulator of Ras-like GTPase activity (Roadblock/LC7/MglB family)
MHIQAGGELTSLVDEVKKTRLACGANALAVVSRDGAVIAADMPKGVAKETFSIMCATILGAGMTAANELGKSPPSRIVLDSEDLQILIVESGRRSMIVAAMPPGSDPYQVEPHLKGLISAVSTET